MTRILIVDDDPDVHRSLSSVLESVGWEDVHAEDGDLGFSRPLTEVPDAIATDVDHPGMDGLKLVQSLRAVRRHLRRGS